MLFGLDKREIASYSSFINMKTDNAASAKYIPIPVFVKPTAVSLALLYLILPNIVFLAGWTTPWVAVPLSSLLILAGIRICRQQYQGGVFLVRTSDLLFLTLTFFLLFFCVLLISLHGISPQSGDMSIRNAMYNTLIACDWPLYSPKGEYFIYYMGIWLPCALASKAFPCIDPQTILSCYIFLALSLAAVLLFFRIKGRIFPFFLILLMLGNLPVIGFPPAMQGITHFLHEYVPFGGMDEVIIKSLNVRFFFPCWLYPLCNSSHLMAYFTLMIAFIISKAIPDKHIPFVASLGLLTSPLSSIALLFFLIIKFCSNLRKDKSLPWEYITNPCTAVAIILCLVAGCWYKTGSSTVIIFLPRLMPGHMALLAHFLVIVLTALFPLFLFVKKACRKTCVFQAALILPFLLPLIIIGGPMKGSDIIVNNNELALKGAIVIHTLSALLLACNYRHLKGCRKAFLAIFLLSCSSFLFYKTHHFMANLTFNSQQMEANKLNEWNGHLDHPEDKHYQQFWTTNAVPSLFLQHSGEAAQGILSPFATGKQSTEASQ